MISEQFGDIYFSVEDGLAETRHTFLEGNNLPRAWRGRSRFCVAETGFGTGLNMLAVWKLFEETAQPDQKLDLVSIEKFPLAPAQIRDALSPWAAELGPFLDRLLEVYPIRVRGFHRLDLSARVSLTLVFDDVRAALPEIDAAVDAWFLDGFAPAKNPDMWCDEVYRGMAALSVAGTTLATFTAAGDVRRGLAEAGFTIEKTKGYGRKRDMTVGRLEQGRPAKETAVPKTVAVIGGGLAGTSAAWHLLRAGCAVTLYEAGDSLATGASGNPRGIINPKLTVNPSPQSDYYTAAYAYARRVLMQLPGIDLLACGGLHLQLDDDKARRFAGYIANLGWHGDHMRLLDAKEASDMAGLPVPLPCLHYPDTLALNPALACAALARGADLRTSGRIGAIKDIKADAVVLANAADANALMPDLSIGRVRGQITWLRPGPVSARLQANLSYGGYITPMNAQGIHVCGATFQPWDETPDLRPEDHVYNLNLLANAVPALGQGLDVTGGRVGFRAASRDRLPIIGMKDGVFLSLAHGSHGIVSGLMAGAMAAAALTGGPSPVAKKAARAVAPGRLQDRAMKLTL